MRIKELKASSIFDSRKEKTINVSIKTEKGRISSSAPNGKSKGKYEVVPYARGLEADITYINSLSDKIKKFRIECFSDLRKIEKLVEKRLGANSLFALESAILKAIAKMQDKELWQFLNSGKKRIKKVPFLIGNCIGGGLHSANCQTKKHKKPDFQEFLFIPETDIETSIKINKRAWEDAKRILKNIDSSFREKLNDENAWQTGLNNEQILVLMQDIKENMIDEFGMPLHTGIDVAASVFFKKHYRYENTEKTRKREEQIDYIADIIKRYALFYIEDALEENDFSGFRELRKKIKDERKKKGCLIVGDDLTVTNLERVKKAVRMKSIDGLIVKPNQIGSLLNLKRVIDFGKKNKIKLIFSHRSGETRDDIIADLAVAFQSDFIKTGITGKGREEKLERLKEIEEELY